MKTSFHEIPEDFKELPRMIFQTSYALQSLMSRALKKNKIQGSMEQLYLLHRITLNPWVSVKDLSEQTLRDYTTVSRHINGLEEYGYILRQSDKNDNRITRFRVTPKGKKVSQKIQQIRHEFQEEILSDFEKNQIESTIHILTCISERVMKSKTAMESFNKRSLQ